MLRSLRARLLAAIGLVALLSVAVAVHHDDPPADALRRGGGRVAERPLVPPADGAGDRGGHDVGLRARLRPDLVVDPVAQAHDERDLERDDRQHQHVRERQQQAEPEAYENSSGAVKRKPTPRTVCT